MDVVKGQMASPSLFFAHVNVCVFIHIFGSKYFQSMVAVVTLSPSYNNTGMWSISSRCSNSTTLFCKVSSLVLIYTSMQLAHILILTFMVLIQMFKKITKVEHMGNSVTQQFPYTKYYYFCPHVLTASLSTSYSYLEPILELPLMLACI